MRSVDEWVGANDDTPVPPRVRLRVFERKGGLCHRCTRKIKPGESWTCEHLIAICNGGANRETNLDLTCGWCLPEKNAEDVAIKSEVARVRKRHLGIRKKSRMPGSRDSPYKLKIGGGVELRQPRRK